MLLSNCLGTWVPPSVIMSSVITVDLVDSDEDEAGAATASPRPPNRRPTGPPPIRPLFPGSSGPPQFRAPFHGPPPLPQGISVRAAGSGAASSSGSTSQSWSSSAGGSSGVGGARDAAGSGGAGGVFGGRKPVIQLVNCFDKQTERMHWRIKELGGICKPTNDDFYKDEGTLLVVGDGDSSNPKRTPLIPTVIAYLVSGKPIVRPAYINDSLDAGTFLDPDKYIADYTRKARQHVRSLTMPFFSGWCATVILHDPPKRQKFEKVLKAGGAEIQSYRVAKDLADAPPNKLIKLNKIFTEPEMQKNPDFERFLTSSRRGGWNTGIFSYFYIVKYAIDPFSDLTYYKIDNPKLLEVLHNPHFANNAKRRRFEGGPVRYNPSRQGRLLVGRVGEEPRRKVPFAQRQATEIINLESSDEDENEDKNGTKFDTKTVWQDRKRAVRRTTRGWFRPKKEEVETKPEGGEDLVCIDPTEDEVAPDENGKEEEDVMIVSEVQKEDRKAELVTILESASECELISDSDSSDDEDYRPRALAPVAALAKKKDPEEVSYVGPLRLKSFAKNVSENQVPASAEKKFPADKLDDSVIEIDEDGEGALPTAPVNAPAAPSCTTPAPTGAVSAGTVAAAPAPAAPETSATEVIPAPTAPAPTLSGVMEEDPKSAEKEKQVRASRNEDQTDTDEPMQTEDTTERPHEKETGERETAVVQEVKPAAEETSEDPAKDPATHPPKAPEKEKSVESWLPPLLVADVADTALLHRVMSAYTRRQRDSNECIDLENLKYRTFRYDSKGDDRTGKKTIRTKGLMGKGKAMDRLTRNLFTSDMQLLRGNGIGRGAGLGGGGDMSEDDDEDWDNPDPGKNLMISLRMLSSLMDCFGHPQEDLMNQFLLTLLNRDDLALARKIHEFLGLVLLQHPPSCAKSRMYYAKIFSLRFRREPLTAPNSDLCREAWDFTTNVLRRCSADPSDARAHLALDFLLTVAQRDLEYWWKHGSNRSGSGEEANRPLAHVLFDSSWMDNKIVQRAREFIELSFFPSGGERRKPLEENSALCRMVLKFLSLAALLASAVDMDKSHGALSARHSLKFRLAQAVAEELEKLISEEEGAKGGERSLAWWLCMLRPCWLGLAVAAAMMRKRQPKLEFSEGSLTDVLGLRMRALKIAGEEEEEEKKRQERVIATVVLDKTLASYGYHVFHAALAVHKNKKSGGDGGKSAKVPFKGMNKMMEKKPSKHDEVAIKLDNKLALSTSEVTSSLDVINTVRKETAAAAEKEEGKNGEAKEGKASALAQLFKSRLIF